MWPLLMPLLSAIAAQQQQSQQANQQAKMIQSARDAQNQAFQNQVGEMNQMQPDDFRKPSLFRPQQQLPRF